MPLHSTTLTLSPHPIHHLVMLHGIYGRGRNWQAIARVVVEARPDYACHLVDLPHHGASGPGAHGDTVGGMAADLEDWLATQHVVPTAILGHSYGGKVALAMAAHASAATLQVWVIDSTPEVKPASGSAWDMLRIVRALPSRFAARTDLETPIVRAGFPVGVAQWMATNLVRDDDGFVWRLDFAVMEGLLNDFFVTDLWSVIESPAAGHDIHILKASRSSAISNEAVRRIDAAASSQVHLHHAEGGHWIHAESPATVIDLLVAHLPS